MKKLLLIPAILLMVGAGCQSTTTPTPANTNTTPTTQTPTPAPTASTQTVTLKFSGAVTKEGTFDAVCRAYFPAENKGILYETHADGWWLQIGDYQNRVVGTQSNPNVGVLNGPTASYTLDLSRPHQVVFGPGLKSATLKGDFKEVLKPNYITVNATFKCE